MRYRQTTTRTFHRRSYGRGGHNKGAAIGFAAFVLVAIAASKGAVGATSGTAPPSTAAVAAEQAYAAKVFGDGPAQQQCLGWLWTRESTWDPAADNSQSGAYGIAQALGHGTDSTAGTVTNEYGPINGMNLPNSVYVGANSGNADDQIDWGRVYIDLEYGSPCNAWDHEEAKSWY
jgi:hypothetical protein